jgi:hypothetical protein
MTKISEIFRVVGGPLCASTALCVALLVTGCNTYIFSPIHGPIAPPALPPTVPSDAPPVSVSNPPVDSQLNSLMRGTVDWFNSHSYAFITNKDAGELGFIANFTSPKIEHAAYHFSITSDQANEVLTLIASSSDAFESIPEDMVPLILTALNSDGNWGHYGLKPGDQTLFFKISLFHPSGQVTPKELDRMLDEALKAMDSGVKQLAPLKEADDEDNSEPDPPKVEWSTASFIRR